MIYKATYLSNSSPKLQLNTQSIVYSPYTLNTYSKKVTTMSKYIIIIQETHIRNSDLKQNPISEYESNFNFIEIGKILIMNKINKNLVNKQENNKL